MSDAIRTQVTEILAHAGVRFSAGYIGEKKKALGGNGAMDQWACTFTRAESKPQDVEFGYFTGVGHRKAPQWRGPGLPPRPGSMLYDQWQTQAKPQAPHPADVLSCLISDSSAADQSFASWCDDFGYDTDSRKAFATYEECQKNADKLRKLFVRETLESLTSALQDY